MEEETRKRLSSLCFELDLTAWETFPIVADALESMIMNEDPEVGEGVKAVMMLCADHVRREVNRLEKIRDEICFLLGGRKMEPGPEPDGFGERLRKRYEELIKGSDTPAAAAT